METNKVTMNLSDQTISEVEEFYSFAQRNGYDIENKTQAVAFLIHLGYGLYERVRKDSTKKVSRSKRDIFKGELAFKIEFSKKKSNKPKNEKDHDESQ